MNYGPDILGDYIFSSPPWIRDVSGFGKAEVQTLSAGDARGESPVEDRERFVCNLELRFERSDARLVT